MTKFSIAAFYKFHSIADIDKQREALEHSLRDTSVRGTILLAREGMNGTIAGIPSDIGLAIEIIRSLSGFHDLEYKESFAIKNPFHRLKVRLKKEIVALGQPEADPNKIVGKYVEPRDWNDFLKSPDTVVIDTRNDYEVAIGSFEGAINPETKSFREFPDWFRQFKSENPAAKIAMFCTGGIRCEKATSFVMQEGIEDVYHLKGGILKYLETVPQAESLWRGECFVFDNRVSVRHGLEVGDYEMCHACRRPINEDDKSNEKYIQGVSCRHCHNEHDDDQRRRFAERQKQIELSTARGEPHIGAFRPGTKAGQ